ncbi:uncharacterized protein PGTG_17812 [Puccinia graminis f. sp. tritici CRL 75-36-700-3]|uniref:Uncharacterized protein n=1 Tax=Puccinia graminis f. sp. tritici (strain CRL 75-36-700-3 / race SCCL) TaxID=418459 RepID=E3L5I7_PUCGT|nr:uncharacterized protein PGTG_17812 [Puccinia graminis f. sp. tritici CRL 75-36-700-3]EFP91812.1 hypothetical protein PGTG_17812 [Puccinia graminis f. sp. tritici CRL 75-36-700-3]
MTDLPIEIPLHIFLLALLDEEDQADYPSSPAYWSCTLKTQSVLWGRGIELCRRAWNKSITLRMTCRIANDQICRQMNQSAILAGLIQTPSNPRSHARTLPCHRLKLYTRNGCLGGLELLKRHSQTLEFFFIEMAHALPGSIWWNASPPLNLAATTFPRLTTFIFRTNSAGVWLSFRNLAELMRNSPGLRHLTVFQLTGPADDEEANELLANQGQPACQLESLHIRRARWLFDDNLMFIVADSHLSLRELTWVFEKPDTDEEGNLSDDEREDDADAFYSIFAPCTEIETLRIADLRIDGLVRRRKHQRRERFNRSSPMGRVLGNLLAKLWNLENLELCGTINIQHLYKRNVDVLPFDLRSLFIDRYHEYRLDKLIHQLQREEGPLGQLESLAIDEQVELDVQPFLWETLLTVCQSRGIQLRIHRDDLSRNDDPEDLSVRLQRLAIDTIPVNQTRYRFACLEGFLFQNRHNGERYEFLYDKTPGLSCFLD